MVSADEVKLLQAIERVIQTKLERVEIEDFEPEHSLPETRVAREGRSPTGNNRKKNNPNQGQGQGQGQGQRRKPRPRRPAHASTG
ncbi:MAG: ATP-dependent RNA helicase RhlE [Candidatus Azotimanducaceae bacterium]